jgi:hypothetical protein
MVLKSALTKRWSSVSLSLVRSLAERLVGDSERIASERKTIFYLRVVDKTQLGRSKAPPQHYGSLLSVRRSSMIILSYKGSDKKFFKKISTMSYSYITRTYIRKLIVSFSYHNLTHKG